MSKGEIIHAEYLHRWMKPKNYRQAGISDLERIVSVIPEPIWYPDDTYSMHTLCDYIIMFDDHSAISAELKGNYNQKSKAVKQIKAGKEYINTVLNMEYRYGLFIVYNKNSSKDYDYHKINF